MTIAGCRPSAVRACRAEGFTDALVERAARRRSRSGDRQSVAGVAERQARNERDDLAPGRPRTDLDVRLDGALAWLAIKEDPVTDRSDEGDRFSRPAHQERAWRPSLNRAAVRSDAAGAFARSRCASSISCRDNVAEAADAKILR
jgi:hypothetical protein